MHMAHIMDLLAFIAHYSTQCRSLITKSSTAVSSEVITATCQKFDSLQLGGLCM